MTRREKILTLLEHYQDALYGIFEGTNGLGIPGLCPAWNHPSYKQLEQLRKELRDVWPAAYWNLAERYFRSTFKRVAVCPVCEERARKAGQEIPYQHATLIGRVHGHGRKSATYEARMVRALSQAIDPEQVSLAVTWLEEHFQGAPSLPVDVSCISRSCECKTNECEADEVRRERALSQVSELAA